MKVSHILQSKGGAVAWVPADTPVAEVLTKLRDEGIGALIVSPDGKEVAGILSERDIVRALADKGADVPGMKAAELMTRKVRVCAPDDDVNGIMQLMTDHRIRHVPVVANGGLVGVVSIGDVVKVRLGELEQEADALRQYIAG